jgi:hypothetical protein
MQPTTTNRPAGPIVTGRGHTDFGPVLVAGAALILFQWVIPMVSSLWIDELGTFWVIDGDLGSTVDRAWRFHGQTPLYYALVWLTTRVFGTSELVMRLPSLIAMAGASVVLFRMTQRMFDRSAAMLATAGFIVIPAIAGAAGDARPYALAMLTALVATDLLDRWHRNPSSWLAAGYGLAAAAVVYSHYVFATILVAHLAYHVWQMRRAPDQRRRRRGTAVAGVTFLLALAPTFPQVAALLGRRDELTFSSTPGFEDLVAIWVLPTTAVVLLAALIWRLVTAPSEVRPLPAAPVVLATLGFVVPPVTLFLMGQLSDVVLWTRRYWMVAFPFGAILIGAMLARLLATPDRVRRGALVILALGVLSTSSFNHSVEDWRGAIASANAAIGEPDTPVLMYVNLIEAVNPDYLEDPERRSYLSSPAAYYPIEGVVTPMPWAFPTDTYPERVAPLLGSIADEPKVVIVANRSGGAASTAYLSGWLTAQGYRIEQQTSHGQVVVTAFGQ